MLADGYWWVQTYSTGAGHGATDKQPPKKPVGFNPPKPKIEVVTPYRPKKGRK